MIPRTAFLLLALASAPAAQQFTDVLWPPMDVGTPERFGRLLFHQCPAPVLDGDLLVVGEERRGEEPWLRTYERKGLNWIEGERLLIAPPEGGVARLAFDANAERVAVVYVNFAGDAQLLLFRRQGQRGWTRRDLTPLAGTGRAIAIDGSWIAVATSQGVSLLHERQGEWSLAQDLPIPDVDQLELDGANLLVRGGQVRVLRRTLDTWAEELVLPTQRRSADLDVDRLIVVGGEGLSPNDSFAIYERSDFGWAIAGSYLHNTFIDQVALQGDLALLSSWSGVVTSVDTSGPVWFGRRAITLTPSQAAPAIAIDGSLVIATVDNLRTEYGRGAVYTYALDGSHATLRANLAQMSLERGGTLTLTLDAGPENAGQLYFLRGSLTGSSPGYDVRGVHIPLNRFRPADPYFPWSKRAGHLDGLGRASISLVLPPTGPGEPLAFLKDRTLHHAFAILQPGRGITHVSNVALTSIIDRPDFRGEPALPQ